MKDYVLVLYIAGHTPRAQRAVAQIRELCSRALAGRYQLDIVDVLERPELAEVDKVLATPTLIRRHPHVITRLVGDLSDTEQVLAWLGVMAGGGSLDDPATAPAPS